MSSGIQFEEDSLSRRPAQQSNASQPGNGGQYPISQGSGMANWLVRKGWAKNQDSAQLILIGLVIANIAITVFVVTYFL